MRILICGLPGSGKTTLAKAMKKFRVRSVGLDGDDMRRDQKNADFTIAGRRKQSRDMRHAADTLEALQFKWVIASYVAPTPELREIFDADFTIFMDTIIACPYQDTNQLWVPPRDPEMIFHQWNDPTEMARWAWGAIDGVRLD